MEKKYEYMALFVRIESGEIVLAFGADVDTKGEKYQIGEPAEDVNEYQIPLSADTNATGIQTIYAHASPGYRYVRIGSSWKRVPAPQ